MHKKSGYIELMNAIFWAGLLAGSLDIIGAILQYLASGGHEPLIIFRYIASAILGKQAFEGGWIMPVCGLLIHFLISYGWTVVFFVLYPLLQLGSKNKYATGILYGLMIWLLMNQAILPMTQLRRGSTGLRQSITGILLLMVLLGLPISLMTHRYFRSRIQEVKSAHSGEELP
jgi:hypothetical protein